MYSRVLRFAPSPNGYLHLGHAYSALLNSDMARELGGRLLLRIEDIDTERCRPEYEAAIYEDLRWLGMSWQEPVRRQSENFADYEIAIARLEAEGLLYPSFESRRELATLAAELDRKGGWPRDPDGVPIYPGRARKMSAAESRRRREAGEPFALRLAMDKAVARAGVLTWIETGAGPSGQTGLVTAAPQMWGDVILARKDSPASYHLAAVVDDALQGVTDIVRGRDLFWSTSIHRLLQVLLGLPEPSYHHHKLILDEARQKLAKSTNATGLRELRAAGVKPFDIRRMVGLGRGDLKTVHIAPKSALNVLRPARSWHGVSGAQGDGMARPRTKQRRKPKRRRTREPVPRGAAGALPVFAHDVRTALTGVLALGELLARSNLGERERRWASDIKTSAEYLAALTTLVIDAAKTEAGALILQREVFGPRALIAMLEAALTVRAETKGLLAAITIADNVPERLVGDPIRLRAALENLLDNAVKFTEQGAVELELHAEPASHGRVRLHCVVRDSGIGLTRAEIKRLFRPFAQASADIAERYGGAGLGLSIVKMLAKRMGGNLTVTSTPGRGSAFHFTAVLPIAGRG